MTIQPTIHNFHHHNSFERFPIEDQSVHLVMTSPPYPMIEMWDEILSQYNNKISEKLQGGKGKEAYELMHGLLDKTWKECYRVLVPGGFMCINVGDATRSVDGRFQLYSNHSRIIQGCEVLGYDTLPSVIWRKPTNAPNKFMGSGMLPSGAYVTLEHEYVLVFRKGGKRSFGKEDKMRRSASAIFWEERNQWYSDQWDIIGSRQKLKLSSGRSRSAAYPIHLALRPILMYSMYGDTVLDPFSGTGTTTAAALAAGRNSIAMDNDDKLLKASRAYPSSRKAKGELSQLIKARYKAHLAYVAEKDLLFFRYKNEVHNIPVKTMQEKKLCLYDIKGIRKVDDHVQASYKKFMPE